MKKYSFYTVFSTSQSFHLAKDPGMIPFILHREFGYNCTFVSYVKKDSNDYYVSHYQGVLLDSLQSNRKVKELSLAKPGLIWYIIRNAKKIDVLNLYFLKYSIVYAFIYRLFNFKGIIYIKLDLNTDSLRVLEKQKFDKFRTYIFRLYLNHIPTIVSAESIDAVEYVKMKFKIDESKLLYIPNGIDAEQIENLGIKMRPFDEKQNLIISVQRVGSYQKNTEMLLAALAKIDLVDWKVVIIGEIEEAFVQKIALFYKNNPSLKNKIQFTGPIKEKKELYELYNRAKIFCLTSRWEGFGLAFVEAQHFGNYIVSTPITSLNDLIKKDFGEIVNNQSELQASLTRLINNQEQIKSVYPNIIKHAQNFLWKNILLRLHHQIESNISKTH